MTTGEKTAFVIAMAVLVYLTFPRKRERSIPYACLGV